MVKSRFQSALERRIADEIDKVKESIANGDPTDFSQYKYWVGYLKALEDALKIAVEVEGDME